MFTKQFFMKIFGLKSKIKNVEEQYELPTTFYEDMDNINLPVMQLVKIDDENDMEIEEESYYATNNITCSKRFLNEELIFHNKKIKKF